MLPVPITTQGETFALVVGEGVSGDAVSNLAHMEPCLSSTTAVGKVCSYADCGFVTTVTVPSGVELDEEYQWLKLQRQELAKHCTRVQETGNFSTTTDDAVEQTTVGLHEYGGGTIAAGYKAPRNLCKFSKLRWWNFQLKLFV